MAEPSKAAKRDGAQRFSGPRVNCENLPSLPAAAVLVVLRDPRGLPRLMVWTDDRSGDVILAARVAACNNSPGSLAITRPDGSCNRIRTIERPMPRNGGKVRLLVCPCCKTPRRALYPWKLNPAKRHAVFTSMTWQCRSCAGLRYSSEGGALVFHPTTALGRLVSVVEGDRREKPEPWHPYIFVNPTDARAFVRITS